jgi:predicted SnoaL-like aldol condensation-catalyzing enzyme
MKHISLSIAVMAAITLISCNNSGTTSTETTSTTKDTAASTEQQNLEKNRSVYKAIESGDSAAIAPLIADDAVDHQGSNGTEVKGGSNIVHMLTDMHNHFKDMKFDIVSDAASGDYVFTMVHVKATAADNTMSMPAGSSMDNKQVDVVKIKDGKMVEHWGFLNWEDVMKMGQKPMTDKPTKK